MMLPNICIIILNWNGKQDTLHCLASLGKLAYPSFEVVVVDNGSTDGSVAAIKTDFPKVTILETGENLGYAGGNNVGIQYGLTKNSDWILLLNNDTEVDPDFLNGFATAIQKQPHVGIWGGKPILFSDRARLDHFGGKWNSQTGQFDLIGLRQLDNPDHKPEPLDYVTGCAILVKKQVFETVGLFEPKFFLFWEEADLCMRAKQAGYCLDVCLEAKLFHKVSASFTGGKPHTTYFWWRNRLLWIERNCSRKDRFKLAMRVLIPEILRLYKLKQLKSIQLKLKQLIGSSDDKKRQQIVQYRAALRGVRDYLFRRFGNGPAWIFAKRS
jgi:GT2 family glycosyltransferase